MLFTFKKIKKADNLHSVTLFSDAFVTALIIYLCQRTNGHEYERMTEFL